MIMRMLKVATLAVVLGAVWPAGARAQDKSSADKKPAEMKIPQPGPEMERLKFLVGTWDVSAEYEKSPMTPGGGKIMGWYKAQLGPGGFSIIADFEEDGPMGEEIGHELLSWDPKQNAYATVTVGNAFPGAVMGTSRWEGENLVTEIQFDAGGGTVHLRSVYSNIQAKSVHIEESIQGADGTSQVIYKADAIKK